MEQKIEVVERELGPTVEIEEHITMLKMKSAFTKGFPALTDYLTICGQEIDKASFYARYLKVDWEKEVSKSKLKMFWDLFTQKWLFRVGVTSPNVVLAHEQIHSHVFPSKKYVRTVHVGPYQEVGKVYSAIVDYAKEKSLSLDTESIEIYLNEPGTVKPAELQTEILVPVV